MEFNNKLPQLYILVILLMALANTATAQSKKGQFETILKEQINYGYWLNTPKKEASNKPLIIFLHGSGEKGNDVQLLKNHGPLAYPQLDQIDAYILAPQCPTDKYWEPHGLMQLIEKVIVEKNIDRSRVYLTGLSMGAWGAWNLAYSYPNTFAALIPIAGFVDRIALVENCKIAHIPTRIYHGVLDDVVDPNYSIEIYKKLKICAKDLKLTLFDDANHDSWTKVYNDPKTYQWLLTQKIN